MDDRDRLEILEASYWENYKFAQEILRFTNPTHPKYIRIQEKLNDMIEEVNIIKKRLESNG